ncbi:helix-turn-helix domain-containing protein, partial [Streptomyces tunisiensis]
RHPLRNCDGCDRAFRSPDPAPRCRDCRTDLQEAA